ncbi:MAG: hypothetical protein K9N06_04335 [Candidatus Cloacimonetes bacterium]|nr:hypothetical protein [Candidatus Cloacimonadota bacterium]
MFDSLDSTKYEYGESIYYDEFKVIIQKIVICYYLMLRDEIVCANNENQIRDVLLIEYLKDNLIRNRVKLNDFIFDREVPEDRSPGRTDIKIQTKQSFIDTDAYYIIECKRLDSVKPEGVSGLNAKYISEGLMRFITEKYSSKYGLNGMIGFIVESMDINQNIKILNKLIEEKFPGTRTIQGMQSEDFIEDFEYVYSSRHNTDSNKQILIYHLMLDFSGNIRSD